MTLGTSEASTFLAISTKNNLQCHEDNHPRHATPIIRLDRERSVGILTALGNDPPAHHGHALSDSQQFTTHNSTFYFHHHQPSNHHHGARHCNPHIHLSQVHHGRGPLLRLRGRRVQLQNRLRGQGRHARRHVVPHNGWLCH